MVKSIFTNYKERFTLYEIRNCLVRLITELSKCSINSTVKGSLWEKKHSPTKVTAKIKTETINDVCLNIAC